MRNTAIMARSFDWTKSSLHLLVNLHPRKPVRNLPKHLHRVQIIVCKQLLNLMAFSRLGLNVIFLFVAGVVIFDGLTHQAAQVGSNNGEGRCGSWIAGMDVKPVIVYGY